jgi:C4-dicarboxylate-specific signal transduction histidine kinase
MRTQKSVILDDADRQHLFSEDPYFSFRRQRSILCLPLIRQATLVGLLYLENALASRVFTPDRARLLELLASQAAISLENARLYADLREREARYREAQNELSHANRIATMGELTASIAHEVNQPIAANITNAETAIRWLNRQPPDVERARQVIGRVIADGKRAADIIGGIRALVKKAPAQKVSLELNEAILEVIELTRAKLSEQGIVLRTELAPGLPLIRGDRVQLQQVVMNLIMNAVEAMSEMDDGGRNLLICTGTEAVDVTVAVRDSGPGLSEGIFDKVFEPFHTTKPAGLGMGLSISRSIVQDHGGRLWASANIPKGASMQFTLPIPAD